MKWTSILLFILVLFNSGCDSQKKRRELNEKEISLNEKEQRLLLKEKTLEIKEQELAKREQKLDSSLKTDTIGNFNPVIIGKWSVKMTCTLATCPGSAVGDTKTELWDISYQANKVVVNALAGDKLVRVYIGNFANNIIELEENPDSADSISNTRMTVRLQITDDLNMEGQREIARDNECRVVYSLQLAKQK
jgi:hypothetical protein